MDWSYLLFGAGLGVAFLLGELWGHRKAEQARAKSAEKPAAASTLSAAEAAPAAPSPPPSAAEAPPSAPNARARAMELARALEDAYQQADRGEDLEAEPRFRELVQFLAGADFDAAQRLAWATSQTMPLSCAAIAAMPIAGDENREEMVRLLGRLGYFPLHWALRHLGSATEPGFPAQVLVLANSWWLEYAASRNGLVAYLDEQSRLGVTPTLPEDGTQEWQLEERRDLLRQLSHPLVEDFLAHLELRDRQRRGRREVSRVARMLGPESADEAPTAGSTVTRERIEALLEALQRPGRDSLVLCGPDGVGKSTLARSALRALAAQGWRVAEASPSQLLAGQKYIGELEQRIEDFIAGVGGERSIWFVPDCHQLLEQGMATGNPTGLLDRLVPYIERGDVQILGESTESAWARVVASRPRAGTLLKAARIEALSDAETLELARDWNAKQSQRLGVEVAGAEVIAEACELARQHFPERAEPGRSLELLKEAVATAQAQVPPEFPLSRELLLSVLAARSGLPLEILDSRESLDVGSIREFFQRRVIGQDEAVDCLVDRIAMLKAGLTDTRRPIGVFLFAGPTGTGKTEIAKTLAQFLFGSPDRMLRVDMSEYQTEDSQWRLLGDSTEAGNASLATRVRQNPFSVVLLDEFEKAHPRVWDLFLQVFDDGRLTDRAGRTADFRHCIIVLTSNLGATIERGGGAGFVATRGGFSREQVDRAIDAVFRREFINRLDRVVVFRPLTRALMRDILHKELRDVLARRGFRSREWAVEWEPSAIEFLLERGFTPDLGARPLRRAIDQYLLAPLARTIVEHRVPQGEQFLFVHAEGEALGVRFVDPDAPTAGAPAPIAAGLPADLRAIALDPRSGAAPMQSLQREIAQLQEATREAAWLALKDAQAALMQQQGFWQRPERQQVLDRIERMDRIEEGVHSAAGLHGRLQRGGARGAPDLVRRLALQIAALGRALDAVRDDEPEDALLELRPADPRSPRDLAWRDRLAAMYRQWAEDRGLRVHALATEASGTALRLEVSGFGAWQGLRGETGAHLLERREGEQEQRASVRVLVAPVPGQLPAAEPETRVCRRYDDGASPLVRDTRGWRTGRLDRVLAGDFDLFPAE